MLLLVQFSKVFYCGSCIALTFLMQQAINEFLWMMTMSMTMMKRPYNWRRFVSKLGWVLPFPSLPLPSPP